MIGAIMTKLSVKSAFAALDEGNVEKMLHHWDENCSFYYPGKVEAGGLYLGKSQLQGWLEGFFAQFPQRKYTVKHIGVENIFDMLGNNTIYVSFDLKLTNKDGLKATNSGVSVITIKGRKAVKEEIFLQDTDSEEYKRSWGDIH